MENPELILLNEIALLRQEVIQQKRQLLKITARMEYALLFKNLMYKASKTLRFTANSPSPALAETSQAIIAEFDYVRGKRDEIFAAHNQYERTLELADEIIETMRAGGLDPDDMLKVLNDVKESFKK